MRLFIDLEKAGKKGARWSRHAYLARLMRPDGTWDYVYPDEKTDGHFLDNGQFQLREGSSLAGIINRELFGGPTGQVDPKTGKPLVKNGRFRTYEVVSQSALERERLAAKRSGRVDPKTGKPIIPYSDALGYEKIGQYRVYEYNKVPKVGEDADGKPIFGGFVSIEFHPSVTGKYGYKIPAKLLQHQVSSPEHVAAAQIVSRGTTIPEGRPAKDPQPQAMAASVVPGEATLHAAPVVTEETLQALGLTIDDTADPLVMAKKLQQRVIGSHLQSPKPGATKVAPLPSWALAKFDNEQDFVDALQTKPMTTMITLGLFRSSKMSRRINEQLYNEWRSVIVGLSRRDFDAYKHTANYDRYKQLDDAAGIGTESPASSVRKYRSDVMQDLQQHGVEALLQLAQKYKATESPKDRFDKYAYRVIERTMARISAGQAVHERTTVPIVHEGDIEEAARQQGGKEPLAPREMAELRQATPVARAAFAKIFHSATMPEAYKRILEARLWLDDASEAEERARVERSAAVERVIDEAVKEQKDVKRPRGAAKWMREFTGRADSLAEVYPHWTDPVTQEHVDLSAMSQKTQYRRLTAWWEQARTYLLRQLSSPIGRAEGAATQSSERVEVSVDPKTLSPEEKLLYTALGQPKTELRALTPEGKAVKRYLELETKLARENRRRWTEATHADLPRAPFVAPRVSTTTPTRLAVVPHRVIEGVRAISLPKKDAGPVHPAVAFFSSSPNQSLAAKLGIKLEALAGGAVGGGVFVTPHLSLGHVADAQLALVEQHHRTLMRLQRSPLKGLAKEHVTAHGKLQALQALGQWSQENGTIRWSHGNDGVSALHDAAVVYRNARKVVLDKQAARNAKRKVFIEAGHTPEEARQAAQIHAPSSADKEAMNRAAAAFQRIAQKVSAVAPTVVKPYTEALRRNEAITDQMVHEAKSTLTRLQRGVGHQLDLIDFESARRVAAKSFADNEPIGVGVLERALLDYDFELGRLHVELT